MPTGGAVPRERAKKGAGPTAASRRTVTHGNLAALGAERLASILVTLAEGSAEVKRRLRLELAAEAGGDNVAAAIGKRLTTLRSARSFIDWDKRRDFVRDLDLQRTMIAGRVAPTRPDLALDLMWRFLDLAEPVMNRVDDSSGTVGDVFRAACKDLGGIAAQARPDPAGLADRVFTAMMADEYGACDGLLPAVLPALGDTGAAQLKTRLREAVANRKAGGQDWRAYVARRALQDIADGQGDVDAFAALVPAAERRRPDVAAEIGHRLLAAGRAAEALDILEKARPKANATRRADDDLYLLHGDDDGWEAAYIEALDATGQGERAQQLRWAAFEERLSSTQLRAFLKRLADFEDVEAEERAKGHALGFRSFPAALDFFRQWPDAARAAQLVLARAPEIDGNLYFLLDPAAQLIESKHRLAATLLRRAMIDDTLEGGKSSRYKHAARHLRECASLAPGIADFGSFETHDQFAARLRAKHGRKTGFWDHVGEAPGFGRG